MTGMNRWTGKPLDGADHLAQSVGDILSTALGERILLAGYGSELPALVDAPINTALFAGITRATVKALGEWEPRLELVRVRPKADSRATAGKVALTLTFKANNTLTTLDVNT